MKRIILLLALAFISSCSHDSKTNSHSIISGSIYGEGVGRPCTVDMGLGKGNIGCELKRSLKKDNVLVIQLDLSKVSKRRRPVCLFDGFAATNKLKSTKRKIETINTLIGSSQVWIELPSIKSNEFDGDLLVQFICTL